METYCCVSVLPSSICCRVHIITNTKTQHCYLAFDIQISCVTLRWVSMLRTDKTGPLDILMTFLEELEGREMETE